MSSLFFNNCFGAQPVIESNEQLLETQEASKSIPKFNIIDLLFRPIPIEEDRSHPPLVLVAGVSAIFYTGSLVGNSLPPFDIACSDVAALMIKNLLREIEQYCENIQLSHYTKIKYILLALNTFGAAAYSWSKNDWTVATAVIGIVIKILDRELNEFLKGPKVEIDGEKIKAGRPMFLKGGLMTVFLSAALVSNAARASRVFTDAMVGSASTTFKHISNQIDDWRKTLLPLGLTIPFAYASDWCLSYLQKNQWIDFKTLLTQGSLFNFAPTLSTLFAKRSLQALINWQIGADEDGDPSTSPKIQETEHEQEIPREELVADDIENAANIAKKAKKKTKKLTKNTLQPAPFNQQLIVLAGMLTITYALLYFTQVKTPQSSTSANNQTATSIRSPDELLRGSFTRATGEMGSYILQQLPYPRITSLVVGGGIIASEVGIFPFQENFPKFILLATLVAAIFGARIINDEAKQWVLDRRLTFAKSS